MVNSVMVGAEVVINEQNCKGCSICVLTCPRGCIQMIGDKLNAQGYRPPTFVYPERCNTCGFCARLCPDSAIEVSLVIG